MTQNLGTPNQKALYSTLGYVLSETVNLLKSDIPKSDKKMHLKITESIVKVSSEMNKTIALEIMRAKVEGERLRSIERKEEVMIISE